MTKVSGLDLISLRAPIANGALAADRLPDRLQVLGWGDNPSIKGNVKLSDLSASRIPQRQKELGFDRVALDFEHNTVPGSPEFERTSEPRSVAAYGAPRVVAGEGLFLENLQWTPAGRSAALNYADLSPAVELDENGNITFVHSVALTRAGAVEGLSFFNTNPNPKPMPNNVITLAALAAILGLPDTAEEAAVTAELKKRLTPVSPPDLTPLSARITTLEKAGDLAALTARLKAIEDAIASGNSALIERERAELINRFSADGKVPVNADGKAYSAEELKALDAATLRLLHANTVATVPLSARGARAKEGGGTLQTLVADLVKAGKTKVEALQQIVRTQPQIYAAWREAGGGSL